MTVDPEQKEKHPSLHGKNWPKDLYKLLPHWDCQNLVYLSLSLLSKRQLHDVSVDSTPWRQTLMALWRCEPCWCCSRESCGGIRWHSRSLRLHTCVHCFIDLVWTKEKFHLSTARWLRYDTVLLEMLNITVTTCAVLHPATLLPTSQDGEEHNCVAAITRLPDLQLFVDRRTKTSWFAVVVELTALNEACEWLLTNY